MTLAEDTVVQGAYTIAAEQLPIRVVQETRGTMVEAGPQMLRCSGLKPSQTATSWNFASFLAAAVRASSCGSFAPRSRLSSSHWLS